MGTAPGSRSGLDSSFRNRLPFVLEICLLPRIPTRFPLGCVEKLPDGLGRLTLIDVHIGLLCSTVESFVRLHNACGGGRRTVLTRELHDG